MRWCFVWIILFFQTTLSAKIYDCFTFFNELELLKVRLEELYDDVDYFVLVEATQTFSGSAKPLYFSENAHLFEKYKDKIICIVVDDFPPPTENTKNDRWVREEFQRNAMLRGLIACSNEDIILISDLDEIPNQRSIKEIGDFFNTHGFYPSENPYRVKEKVTKAENQFVCELHMRLFVFSINHESLTGWNGAVKAAPYWLVKKRTPWDLKILHMHDRELPKIYNAGSHFHSMGGRERLIYKLKSIDPSQGVDNFWNNTHVWYSPFLVPIDDGFPKYIREHIDYFISLGWLMEK